MQRGAVGTPRASVGGMIPRMAGLGTLRVEAGTRTSGQKRKEGAARRVRGLALSLKTRTSWTMRWKPSSQDTLSGEPDSQGSFSSMDVDWEEEASSQDTLSEEPGSQGSFLSMDLDEEDEVAGNPASDEAGETDVGGGQGRGAGGRESGGAEEGARGPRPESCPRASQSRRPGRPGSRWASSGGSQ